MGEKVLPTHGSAESYVKALKQMVERYKQSDEPVSYKKAAGDMSPSGASRGLKFFSKIGLVESPKAGQYFPKDFTYKLIKKRGQAKEKAQEEAINHLREKSEIFDDLHFQINLSEDEKDLQELTKSVVNSAALDKDEESNVERFIEILAGIDLLELREDGKVALSANISEEKSEKQSKLSENQVESEESKKDATEEEKKNYSTASENIEVNISMDATEMEEEEMEKKLELINEVLK